MSLYLVTIQDKELNGEPDIGMCIVEAESEEDALAKSGAWERCIQFAGREGRGRCVPHARRWSIGMWCRTSSLIRGAQTTRMSRSR